MRVRTGVTAPGKARSRYNPAVSMRAIGHSKGELAELLDLPCERGRPVEPFVAQSPSPRDDGVNRHQDGRE